jgi:hypothetical protein
MILNGNNNIKRILKKYKFKNNLSKEKFDEIDIDSLPRNSALRSLLEFQNKERELIKIKNNLILFTSALKNMDLVKNARNHYEANNEGTNKKESRENFEETINEVVDSENKECIQEQIQESKKDA